MTLSDNAVTRSLLLVSHHLCPYVQRAAITLAEKDVPFERIYIDLANKPDWFLAISPLGKVPLLLVRKEGGRDETIFESAVICEYLEETERAVPLLPSDPLARAKCRSWIEFASSILADLWDFETATEPAPYEKARRALAEKFRRLEATLGDGPFFLGSRFTLVDAAFAPVFRYFDVFDAISDTQILSGLPKIAAWRRALAARPSVQAAAPEDYGKRLRAFLAGRGAYLLKAECEAS